MLVGPDHHYMVRFSPNENGAAPQANADVSEFQLLERGVRPLEI